MNGSNYIDLLVQRIRKSSLWRHRITIECRFSYHRIFRQRYRNGKITVPIRHCGIFLSLHFHADRTARICLSRHVSSFSYRQLGNVSGQFRLFRGRRKFTHAEQHIAAPLLSGCYLPCP